MQRARIYAQQKAWRERNKDWYVPKANANRRKRYATDPVYRAKVIAAVKRSKAKKRELKLLAA